MNVAQFRNNSNHLEALFHVKRHACVGDKEKAHFDSVLVMILSQVKRLDCKTIKPADVARQKKLLNLLIII